MSKNALRAYFQFSRAERSGIIALLLVVLTGIGIHAGLDWFTPEKKDDPKVAALELAMRQFAAEQDIANDEGTGEPIPNATLFVFDPNKLDSAGFVQLGLRPRTIQKLLNWRRKGKVFYRKEEFAKVWTLTPEEYARLEPYISIKEEPSYAGNYGGYKRYEETPLPAVIDLNTTDSATLVRLNGIGPTLAHRIVERRRALGGFMRHEQLTEIYRFPDTTFNMLRQKLAIRTEAVRKIPINRATEDELAAHPYVGEKTAKNIVLYRDALKSFTDIKQLRQVPLMNEEIYRKIAPYFSLE